MDSLVDSYMKLIKYLLTEIVNIIKSLIKSEVVMKKIFLILLLLGITSLAADFILPSSDPIYPFLEMTNNLKLTNLNHFQYPLYYNEIMAELSTIREDRKAPAYYKQQADYHYRRLKMDYDKPLDIALYPPKKVLTTIGNLFRKDPTHQRLITITDPKEKRVKILPIFTTTKNETYLYVSGILGYQYDNRTEKEDTTFRARKYYGIETAGNFSEDFGFFLRFKKGHYNGNTDFIQENPFLSIMGDDYYADGEDYYQVDMQSELDFKNQYLDLSIGYGSFDIGRSFTSSVILNSSTTPYGYLKFHKAFGLLEYNGITTQLIPDTLASDKPYLSKSMSIQHIALHTSSFSFGLGNSIIYGDKTFDIAYSSPLALYKIIDNKNHGRDNALLFGYFEVRPLSGLNIYGNFLYDDLRNNRFSSKEWLSYSAYQAGLAYQVATLPLEVGAEGTVVGPSTYSHKSGQLTYMTDNMLLGSKNGSNFLSLATRIRVNMNRVAFGFMYENIQQGDVANHPSNGVGDMEFLKDNIVRKQSFVTHLDYYIIPELYLFGKYEYRKLPEQELHYIYTGAEFKY